jgi:hypothetical protein
MFFGTPDNEGWSESVYLSATDLIAAQTAMDTLLPLRAALLASTEEIVYARVSDVTVKGDSLLTTVALPVPGTYSPVGASLLEANTALLLVLFANPTQKNRIFLRGLRSDTIVGREYKAPSAFATALTGYKSGLIAANCMTRNRATIGPPPTYTYHVVTSIAVSKATARKPGRPFGLPLGRRRV